MDDCKGCKGCVHDEVCDEWYSEGLFPNIDEKRSPLNRAWTIRDIPCPFRLPKEGTAEVRHWRWIAKTPYTYSCGNMTLNGTGESCSLCGWVNKAGVDKFLPFCPNCGARMDGGSHGQASEG